MEREQNKLECPNCKSVKTSAIDIYSIGDGHVSGELQCEECSTKFVFDSSQASSNINISMTEMSKSPIIEKEMVNHPDHYQGNGMETIDVIEAFNFNFNLGSTFKYMARLGKKDDPKRELRKAIWYLERELSKYE